MSKKEFIVKGSYNNSYKVINDNGYYSCECKSFFYRKKCKHVENIKLNMSNRRNIDLNQSSKREQLDASKIKLAKQSIKTLRNKILVGSTTNRNRLINFKHSDRKRDQIRIVDELPDEMYKDLIADKSFVFRPLPEPTFQPKDENTKEFKTEFLRAQKEDETFLSKIKKMGDKYDGSSKESLEVERELKDRVRIKLKMKKRPTPEIIGLAEYAKKQGINPNFNLPKSKKDISEKHKDKNLQTILTPELLDKKMSGTKRLARQAQNEKGIDTLFLAIGFVQWYESPRSEVSMLSPLLLLPVELTEIKRSKGAEFQISAGDSDLQVNIALKAKFEKDFGIKLKDVEENDTPESYFEKFEDSIKQRKKWNLKRFVTLGHFPFARMAMYYDLDPSKWEDLGSQKNLQDIFSGSGDSDGSIAEEHDIDDETNHSKVPLLLNQADSSQFSTIIDVMNGENIALQGPPGTGKSQTITNIIGSALAKGQKVLFLADKKAALDVVYKKIQEAGLEEFCLRVPTAGPKAKSEVIEDIKKRVNLKTKKMNSRDLSSEIKKEKEIRNKLRTYKRILTTSFGRSEKDVYEILGLITKYKKYQKKIFNEIFDNKKNNFSDKIEEISSEQVNIITENLDNIEEQSKKFRTKYKNIKNHPWYGFAANRLDPYAKKELIKKIIKLDNFFNDMIIDILVIKKNQNIKEIGNIDTLDELTAFIKKFLDLKDIETTLENLRYITSPKDLEKLKIFVTKTKTLLKKLEEEKKINNIFHLKKINISKARKIKKILEKSGAFSIISSDFRNTKKEYLNSVKTNRYQKKSALENIESLLSYYKNLPVINKEKNEIENDRNIKKLLKKKFDGINTDLNFINNVENSFKLFQKQFSEKSIKEFLKNQNLLGEIIKTAKKIEKIKINIEEILESFHEYTDKNFLENEFHLISIDKLKIKFKKLDPKLLDDWISFTNVKKDNTHFENIILDCFDKNEIKYENLSGIFKALYYNSLLKNVYIENPELSEFDGDKLSSLQNNFKEIDGLIFDKMKEQLRNKLNNSRFTSGISRGSTKNLSEFGLIDRIINQKKPRISLRQLIKRSSIALSEMKPCFMMSPIVLAELVNAKEELFDLLIIDEASQMRTEDAIGGLARSKQCVIVGDPEQLAPTSFFDVADQDEDEDDELTEESVLDLALSRFKPKRMLRWHYRSRNEKLINFSNHHFYENQLIIPPSPIVKSPIFFNHVKSLYKGKINNQEKEALIDGLEEFMKNNIRKNENDKKSKSCLVVTMNKSQQELIEDSIRFRENNNKVIEDYRKSWDNTLEKFTVKNLESVQGDERDCIFISTVFGPNEKGKVLQTFGPINNQDKGHRRLNVLFTRAKKEIRLYTSMSPNDILVNDAPRGRIVFKNYIEYAKTGKLEIGDVSEGKEPMSEFEVFVKEGLERMGYQVDPQVGVSGFYIDLGIKHKSFPDGYIVGVECDGRAYHSSKSQRDNDILRQSVLEDLGWKIYRIWSTDWFYNPQKELNKLDRYIKKLI